MIPNDEETFLAFTTQLSSQASNGANTDTIEKNSLTFEYKVSWAFFVILQLNSGKGPNTIENLENGLIKRRI